MENQYFRIELKYDLYFNINREKVNITIPAYEIYNKECYTNYISNEVIAVFYYHYIVFVDNKLKFRKALIFNNKNNNMNYVPISGLSKSEYMEKAIKIDRRILLLEQYEKTSKGEINFKYGNVKPFEKEITLSSKNIEFNQLEKVKEGLEWLISQFSHCPQDNYDIGVSVSELIKEGKRFNCRNMAIILNSLYLSWKLKSRYIICIQKEERIDNSHFMVEVYIQDQKKWIAVDSSYGLLFTDSDGKYLSLRELREYLGNKHQIILEYVNMSQKINPILYFKSLLVKLYRFRRPIISNDFFDTREQFIELVPVISAENRNRNITLVDSPELFWQ